VLKAGVERHRCPPTLAEVVRITLWRLLAPTPRGHGALGRFLRLIQKNVNSFPCRPDNKLIHSID
jgi:hypothetical protein